MRVLDMGCGFGTELTRCGFGTELTQCGVASTDNVVGIDQTFERLVVAAGKFSQRRFVQGQGKALPSAHKHSRVLPARWLYPT